MSLDVGLKKALLVLLEDYFVPLLLDNLRYMDIRNLFKDPCRDPLFDRELCRLFTQPLCVLRHLNMAFSGVIAMLRYHVEM